MKDLWIEAHERFVDKHDREPTDKEMQQAYEDYYSGLIDAAQDAYECGDI